MVKEESTLGLVTIRTFLEMEDTVKGKEQVNSLFGDDINKKWHEPSKEAIEFEERHGNDYFEGYENIKGKTIEVSEVDTTITKEEFLEKVEQVVEGLNNLEGVRVVNLRANTIRDEGIWDYTLVDGETNLQETKF